MQKLLMTTEMQITLALQLSSFSSLCSATSASDMAEPVGDASLRNRLDPVKRRERTRGGRGDAAAADSSSFWIYLSKSSALRTTESLRSNRRSRIDSRRLAFRFLVLVASSPARSFSSKLSMIYLSSSELARG